ncbi:hypothetical protein MUP95_07715 [bacterium]|nr:hypothetical protein [bacterium]
MNDEKKNGRKHVETASITGPIWYIGWSFTIAFAKLSFWKAVLAFIIWPYYLGSALSV